ncbi:hypothetical protein KA977_06105 [Candidatus Dependentiae bacterium]|nr:hypothetical protein [Candidatus Dependentiae bacterium]
MNISNSYLQCETSKLQYEEIFSIKYPKIQFSKEESVSDVILNISRENQKSAGVDIVTLKDAADMVNNLNSALQSNPAQALLCQGNISKDAVKTLI